MENNQLYNAPEDLLFGFCYDFLAKAHEIFRQHCFENDFVNRCIDRYTDEIGQRNLPYATLSDEKALLTKAYEIYCKNEDCNVAYNDTLDLVVDEIEELIQQGLLTSSAAQPNQRVSIVLTDGIVTGVYSTNPDIQVEITDLDTDYATSEQQDSVNMAIQQDKALFSVPYVHSSPGYDNEEVTD